MCSPVAFGMPPFYNTKLNKLKAEIKYCYDIAWENPGRHVLFSLVAL